MKTTLKDLKETKGVKKEFKFLTPLSKLIEKEYKEIIDLFTFDNWKEAALEVTKNFDLLAVYETPSKLKFTKLDYTIRHNSFSKPTKKKENPDIFSIKEIEYKAPSSTYIATEALSLNFYYSSFSALYSDLYVVTDLKGLEKYSIEERKLQEEDALKMRKKTLEKDIKDAENNRKRIEKYGITISSHSFAEEAISILEALEGKDTKKQFEALTDALEASAEY